MWWGRTIRGAALATVLALMSIILLIGLAMTTLSTLSLQFSQRHLDSTRSEMAARSGLAHFIARVREFESTEDDEFNPLEPKPQVMTDVFPDGLEFTQNGYRVSFHFDGSGSGYRSTDNLAGEEAKIGVFDDDGVARIPPFAVDLMINVEGPMRDRTYRAILKRNWPFAIYSKHGRIILMGQPELKVPDAGNLPTRVQGDVYTMWDVELGMSGRIANNFKAHGYGLGPMRSASQLLANLEARVGFQPYRLELEPLVIGMRGHLNFPPRRFGIRPNDDQTELFYYYNPDSWDYGRWPRKWGEEEVYAVKDTAMFPPPGGFSFDHIYNEVGSVLEGDLFYSSKTGGSPVEAIVFPSSSPGAYPYRELDWPLRENRFEGRVYRRRKPSQDPFATLRDGATLEESGQLVTPRDLDGVAPIREYAAEILEIGSPKLETKNDLGLPPPSFLTETLVFTENRASLNGEELPPHPRYTINGSLSNRQVAFHEDSETLFVRESNAGLDLQGVTVHVKGDLDLGAASFDWDEAVLVRGVDATLVVDGQLVLGNAHIDGGDQAFVIYARDIVIKGGGTFRGLLIASRSISIVSDGQRPLRIEGGIACTDDEASGGITIRGADIVHDARYLKAINGGGEFYLSSWQKR